MIQNACAALIHMCLRTATAIRDFNVGENLPLMIFANWRGFSGAFKRPANRSESRPGGTRDMYGEVLKFGAQIVDALVAFGRRSKRRALFFRTISSRSSCTSRLRESYVVAVGPLGLVRCRAEFTHRWWWIHPSTPTLWRCMPMRTAEAEFWSLLASWR